jgi:transketolase
MDGLDFRASSRSTDKKTLELAASRVREDIILMLGEAKSGHPGGSLSCTDILVSLYFGRMRHDPKEPKWTDRDRFLLSKGHAAPALYATLAECGYFPKEELKTLRKFGTRLQGHPDPKKLPGVEIPGGPEGIGLSEGTGMALAARMDKKALRIYVMLGDGELDSGEIWEAAMSAAKFKLDNLVAIVDLNGLQQEGKTSSVMPSDSVSSKFRAFNWNVIEIDGHSFDDILSALNTSQSVKGTPTAIIARTVKGKGVDFMEGKVESHSMVLTPEMVKNAQDQIRKNRGN